MQKHNIGSEDSMELQKLSKLTIGDIMEFAPVMSLTLKQAQPVIDDFKEKHGLDGNDIKNVCRVVQALGLYA
jgi:hypothetical protein